jgi:hypothetical protein
MGSADQTVVSKPLTFKRKAKTIPVKVDSALRYYYCGIHEVGVVAKLYKVPEAELKKWLETEDAEKIRCSIQAEKDIHFQSLYGKVVDTLNLALDHPDPQVALAGANLWLRSNKGTKIEVVLTAEDVVRKIMSGELVE